MYKNLLFACVIFLAACSSKKNADLLVYNATIYTVDSTFSTSEAMVVAQGKIVATGSKKELEETYETKEKLDAEGKFIYPGLIDAHAHFLSYGIDLQTVDLVGTQSWDEVLQKLQDVEKNLPAGSWLLGRGWDQNDWTVKEFPTKEKLDELFPGRPVFLTRVDGHAAMVNQKALDEAGIQPGRKLVGGDVVTKDGKLTGLLVDNAMDLVSQKIPALTTSQLDKALLMAQKNCFAVGLTTVDDCGLDYSSVELIRDLQKNDSLKIRLFVMLSDASKNYDYAFKNGKIKTDRLNVSSFKVYADGALGSRGACLLKPYSDWPGWFGFLLSAPSHYDSVANILYQNNWQMCTHAIGDSANRIVLNTYGKYLKGENDRRWRIEHAQVVNKNDFSLFGKYNIIPSVQPTHGTSDMYWAEERLGSERVKGAYAFKELLMQNGWIPLGTDFPVEDISPFKTFYAAIVRKDSKGFPPGGYQMENALSREQALRGITIWAARSNFEEKEKGSLEAGKFADFVILDKDLMRAPESELLNTNVLRTYVNGELVYRR